MTCADYLLSKPCSLRFMQKPAPNEDLLGNLMDYIRLIQKLVTRNNTVSRMNSDQEEHSF